MVCVVKLHPLTIMEKTTANKQQTTGSQVFLSREAPRYYTAFATHLGCYSFLVIIILFFRWHLVRQNRKRDEMAAAGVHEAHDENLTHAFEDLTDRENPNFRYVY